MRVRIATPVAGPVVVHLDGMEVRRPDVVELVQPQPVTTVTDGGRKRGRSNGRVAIRTTWVSSRKEAS